MSTPLLKGKSFFFFLTWVFISVMTTFYNIRSDMKTVSIVKRQMITQLGSIFFRLVIQSKFYSLQCCTSQEQAWNMFLHDTETHNDPDIPKVLQVFKTKTVTIKINGKRT